MKVFLTGGTGFIGKVVLEKLVARGDEVWALARSDSSAAAVDALGAHAVRGDLDDVDALRTSMSGCDVVFHVAGWYKQGDPFFRDTLYLLGYHLALHCPYFGNTFLDAVERGKSEVEATIHTAHKVNRVFIHLLQHDEPFDPPGIRDYDAFRRQWEVRMHRYLAEKEKSRQPKSKQRRRPRKQR